MAATMVLMPRLSPTMEEGVLAKWLKKEGDKISPGDVIAEVETDKANMDFPLEDEGVLLKLLAQEGQTVRLGAPVAILGAKGDSIDELLASLKNDHSSAKKTESSMKLTETKKMSIETVQNLPTAQTVNTTNVSKENSGRIKASPLAKVIAKKANLALEELVGTGPMGRIVKADVDSYLHSGRPIDKDVLLNRSASSLVLTPLSMMRKTIARRLVESKRNVPHFYLTMDVDVDALSKFRDGINQNTKEGQPKISFNDLVIKAVAVALAKNPDAHRSYTDEGLQSYASVDIGVAVSIPDGLVTPVIRGADKKSIVDISKEVRLLADRAKQKKLDPQEYQGATFSVSNLGMYGIREFSAIINPPESGILAVGAVDKRAIVVEQDGRDSVIVKKMMTLTLSCDHRVIDGVLGAQLLGDIKKALEQPLALIF